MPEEQTNQQETSPREILATVVPDQDLGAVTIQDPRVLNDGTTWAVFRAYLHEETIGNILDRAFPEWEWKVLEVRDVTIRSRRRPRTEAAAEEKAEPPDATGATGIMVVGELRVGNCVRTGIGYDVDPRAAATYAFKDAAEKWGVGRFLVAPRYTAYVKFADLAAYRKFVARRPSWADVVALVRASSAGSGA